MIYTIEADNNTSAFASAKEAEAVMIGEYEQFGSAKELAKLAAQWPGSRLIEVWNSLPGVTPVKKFKDRATGATRIWEVLRNQQSQSEVASADLPDTAPEVAVENATAQPEAVAQPDAAREATPDVAPDSAPETAPVAPKKAKVRKRANKGENAPTPRTNSKTSQVLELIRQPEGASLAAIMEATRWAGAFGSWIH